MGIVRTEGEIREEMYKAADLQESGEDPFFGETYASGVEAALRWILNRDTDAPLTDVEVQASEGEGEE